MRRRPTVEQWRGSLRRSLISAAMGQAAWSRVYELVRSVKVVGRRNSDILAPAAASRAETGIDMAGTRSVRRTAAAATEGRVSEAETSRRNILEIATEEFANKG